MFFTTIFLGIGLICIINFITTSLPRVYYNRYLRPIKVEDAKIAEEDQLLNDVFDSDSDQESDQKSDQKSDQESDLTSKDKSCVENLNIQVDHNHNEFDSDVNESESESEKDDKDEIEPGEFIIFKINYDIDSEDESNEEFRRPRRSISTYGKQIVDPIDTYINKVIGDHYYG